MMLEWLLLLSYAVILIIFEKIINLNKGRKFSITFNNFFFIALVAYTLLPILDCLINERHVEYVGTFLGKTIILVVSLTVGYVFGKKIKLKKDYFVCVTKYTLSKTEQYWWVILYGAMVVLFLMINIVLNRGGLSSFLGAAYRESYTGEQSTVIGSLLYASMPYAMIFNEKTLITQKGARFIALMFSSIIIILNFLGGNRNLAVMIAIAVVWTMFREFRFNKMLVYSAMVVGIVFLGLIAVFREYSVINVLNGSVQLNWDNVKEYCFSFSKSEVGTTFHFERYQDRIVDTFRFPYAWGYSYFVLSILNIIPSSIWAGRPMAYADYFSRYAFGSFDGLGYGFSPIFEAEINFGLLWWIVFFVLGMALAKISDWTVEKDINKYFNAGLMACLVLNFFRIDFATCVKFFAMMWCFKWLYLMSFQADKKIKLR